MSDRAFYGPADSWLEDKQVVFAEEYHKLERELADAKAELERAKQERNEAAMRERNKFLSQLTAHKAALEKCEKALTEVCENNGGPIDKEDTTEGLFDYVMVRLNDFKQSEEALAAIKQLKQQ